MSHLTTHSVRATLRVLLAMAFAYALIPGVAHAEVEHRRDLASHFEQAGTTGSMVVRRSDDAGHGTVVVGGSRSQVRFLPSSTFKIPNSLIALDEGVAAGPGQLYPGPNPNYEVDGKPLLPATCEDDLTLARAFTFSCIPIYQQIARDLGWDVYKRELREMRYGNRLIHHAPLDSFWLEGRFGISAREQVRFLERLRTGALRSSVRTMADVREMMVSERGDDYVIRAKTGYVFSTTPRLGWWVGWIERGGRSWTFALNMDMTEPSHFGARVSVGKAILRDLGALDR